MGKDVKPSRRPAPRYSILLCSGVLIGALWAFRLDDEQRRRIRKSLFEMRELPFRIFV